MGYTHNTAMAQFVPPNVCMFTAGTWTPTITGDVPTLVRTAADVDATIIIPLNVPGNSAYREGSQITSVDVYWKNATADLTALTPKLELVTLKADGTAVSGIEETLINYDAGHDTAAKRITQAEHMMTITFNTPRPWLSSANAYYLNLFLDTGAAAVFTFKGARIIYSERT